MRFKKRTPKEVWTEEKTRTQISLVRESIASLNRDMNALNDKITILNEQKEITKRKLQRKWKYLTQLQNQLGNSVHERIMKEYIEKNKTI